MAHIMEHQTTPCDLCIAGTLPLQRCALGDGPSEPPGSPIIYMGKESACLLYGRPRFNAWVGKIPWRREWLPTPVFLPGEVFRYCNMEVTNDLDKSHLSGIERAGT